MAGGTPTGVMSPTGTWRINPSPEFRVGTEAVVENIIVGQ